MLGKIDASLSNKLKKVEWGEYPLSQLFTKVNVNSLKYKTSEIPSKATIECPLPALTAGIQNQGLNNYVPLKGATVLKNIITISANGANTGATFYQSKEFTVLQDAYAIDWIYDNTKLTGRQYLFLVGAITKTIRGNYEWTNKAGWERIKNEKIQLPIRNNEIYFDFMENFVVELEEERIAELVSYLKISELDDYVLTFKEKQSINNFYNLEWANYNLKNLFGESTRGKRLKSEYRIPGNLPFVTAGETDEGVSDFIGNNVRVFSKNTTTIDMFGSAKYRNYEYGGDDHVAIIHTEDLPMNAAIFVTSAIHKSSHNGQFDYGRNFYAKDADELYISLPTKDGKPDFDVMATTISAIRKIVIKDVVLYAKDKYKEIYTYVKENKIDNVKDVHGQVDYENSSKLNMVAEDGEDYKLEEN